MRPDIRIWVVVLLIPLLMVVLTIIGNNSGRRYILNVGILPFVLIFAPLTTAAIFFLSVDGKQNSVLILLLIIGVWAQTAAFISVFDIDFGVLKSVALCSIDSIAGF